MKMKRIIVTLIILCMTLTPVTVQAKTPTQVTKTETKIKKRYKKVRLITRTKHNWKQTCREISHRKGKRYYLVEKFQGVALNKVDGRDPNGYYISYKYVKGVRKGSKVITYLVYSKNNNEPDDIIARYDVVIKH